MTPPAEAGRQPVELQAATRRKAEETHARAVAALARMRKSGAEITFASVAREASVSTRYLYNHDDLVEQIVKLRPSLARQPLPPPTGTESGIVTILRAKIVDQQRQIADLKAQIRKKEQDLAAAVGEVIKIRNQRGRTAHADE